MYYGNYFGKYAKLHRLDVMRQFGGIIIVLVAFVTIIGKSLTLGSLNKSVCVNISTIFASCQHWCMPAEQFHSI